MFSRKGFTLIELMVVILIVAILAAVAIPIMRGRIDAAKWSEGKAMLGTIATAIRAYVAERNEAIVDMSAVVLDGPAGLGFAPGDLDGTYFKKADFTIESGAFNPNTNTLTFVLRATKPVGISYPDAWELDQSGQWNEITGGP